jgi:hypothetical protein
MKKTPEEKAKAKEAKIKAETASREALNNETKLKQLREMTLGVPAIQRKVGDRVQLGAVKRSVIKEIYDQGKIYLLDETATEHNYGNPYDVDRFQIVAWYAVETYYTPEEISQMKQLSYRDDIRLNFRNSGLEAIINMFHQGMDMNPKYQRGNVWDLRDKLALIDSIFNNVDIGKFTFIMLPFSSEGPKYEVLDGKQRVSALVEFYEGRFEYKGLKFRDMHPMDRNHFERYDISYALTEGLTLAQKVSYFLKVNTTGKPQDPEHLENMKVLLKSLVK